MINICYLSHKRYSYHDLTFYFLNKIKPENKNKIHLTILETEQHKWNLDALENINVNIMTFPMTNNYMNKISYATNLNYDFSIKLDEDCFINNHVWDYIIENIEILNNEENLLISPTMSNNIPSCDNFISDFIEEEDIKNKIYLYFLNRPMPTGLWGVDYAPLNQYTINAKQWDSEAFYNGVANLPTRIKGIHPLRISYEAQILINNYVLENINTFTKYGNYSLNELKAPYFTNSLFAIKTSEWKKILTNRDIDAYDEIALNTYKRDTDKKFLFIKNGFGLHPMYNTVYGNKNPWGIGGENGEEVEAEFYNNLIAKIKS